ncbi:hypothetical protein ABPG75_009289 [Micractinium tetrahymenae]
MSDAPPAAGKAAAKAGSKGKKAGKKPAAAAEPEGPRPPFKPAKMTHYDRQVVDYVRTATAKNIWYYRDRLSTPRGPCSLPVLREAWTQGVIDENTLVWGQGLADWLPVRNVRTLVPQIRTVEVQIATWMKKTFGLKPALARARKERAEQRAGQLNSQVDMMY